MPEFSQIHKSGVGEFYSFSAKTVKAPSADILVNFNAAVDFVSVVFPDTGENNQLVSLRLYNAPQMLVLDTNDAVAEFFGNEPTTLSGMVPDIRAAQFESNGVHVFIGSVEFELQQQAMPEPGTLAVFGLGLASLCFAGRRRRHRIGA